MKANLETSRIYTDFQGFSDLRLAAREDSEAALKEVASQFEAIFIQMMLKSMREANLAEGIFDSQQSEMYMGMFDQQIALDLSVKGAFGIADMMVRQLQNNQLGQAGLDASTQPAASQLPDKLEIPGVEEQTRHPVRFDSPQAFIDYMMPRAKAAAEKLGVSPQLLVAQAALETGWGNKIGSNSRGESSHNLFGIKADARWPGKQVRIDTLEFRDGLMQREQASFRAYDSFQQSFEDYVDFVQRNSRYEQAMRHDGDPRHYINGLQQAGYATDPAYAEKVLSIMEREFG